MKHAINERIKFSISRTEANFDRACDAAYRRALIEFDCDDDGHLNNVVDSERSTDSIVVEFKSYRHYGSMGGQTHEYDFEIWVDRYDDEDEDEDEDEENDDG